MSPIRPSAALSHATVAFEGTVMRDGVTTDFDKFVGDVQGRVRRALTPVAGAEAARQATVDALVHAWADWERVRAMANPAGYVYTVARSRLRQERPPDDVLPDDFAVPDGHDPTFEPQLVPLLAALPGRQRVAVYLVHGCRWPVTEVAALRVPRGSARSTTTSR